MEKTNYVKVIPLGGLGEIGKNMTVFETPKDIIIIDCGMAFPDEEMLGIDMVIPDFSYLEDKKDKVKALLITHGHEDHIGAIPYFVEKFNVPIYGSGLSLGIIENKLAERKLLKKANLQKVNAGTTLSIGDFKIEFIHVNHSISDAFGIAIDTPVGKIVHTGDFKVDFSPLYDDITDLTRFGELGKEGVRLLLMDSTNAEKASKTNSERIIRDSFDKMFKEYSDKRMIFATFSTNTNRIQTIFNLSAKYGRKVALTGRSMLNIVDVAMAQGYIKIPEDTLIDIDDINSYPKNEITIITTGSQGEPMSALYRLALSEHKKINLTEEDIVILSSKPIPGNEKAVNRVINMLLDAGIQVIHSDKADVHVSGHACQEELALIHSLVKPENFMPVHGEVRQLLASKRLAESLGIPTEKIFISNIGRVLIMTENSCQFIGEPVKSGEIFVDGAGVGDIGSIVLKDRRNLSEDGLVLSIITIDNKKKKIVAGPDIISRGFVYVKESEELMQEIKKISKREVNKCLENKDYEWASIKSNVKDALHKYIFAKTKRNPMILPVIISI